MKKSRFLGSVVFTALIGLPFGLMSASAFGADLETLIFHTRKDNPCSVEEKRLVDRLLEETQIKIYQVKSKEASARVCQIQVAHLKTADLPIGRFFNQDELTVSNGYSTQDECLDARDKVLGGLGSLLSKKVFTYSCIPYAAASYYRFYPHANYLESESEVIHSYYLGNYQKPFDIPENQFAEVTQFFTRYPVVKAAGIFSQTVYFVLQDGASRDQLKFSVASGSDIFQLDEMFGNQEECLRQVAEVDQVLTTRGMSGKAICTGGAGQKALRVFIHTEARTLGSKPLDHRYDTFQECMDDRTHLKRFLTENSDLKFDAILCSPYGLGQKYRPVLIPN